MQPSIFFLVVSLVLGSFSLLPADQAIIAPDIDVYIVTFGGGEGLNSFLKYDISPVSPGMVIDSVFLRAYVWEINGTWDGDVMFCNVNDQAWTEADSCRHIIDLPLSDSVLQTSGFGEAIGFSQSDDITTVFLHDYTLSNTFCSVKLKDPDDGTFNPMPGSYPVNSTDTLGVGNRAFGFYIYFYPSEYANAPPWLVVNYHATGVQESPQDLSSVTVIASPNPFSTATTINLSGMAQRAQCIEVRVYDLCGRLVRNLVPRSQFPIHNCTWDGKDDAGLRVAPGIYFCRIDWGEGIRTIPLLLAYNR